MNHDANTEGGAAGEKGKTYTENVFFTQPTKLGGSQTRRTAFALLIQAETSKKPTAVDTEPRHRVRKTLSAA